MKPDWKDAPEWANYLARDADGVWCWYESEPVQMGWAWADFSLGRWEYSTTHEQHWSVSLEGRPA